MSYNIDSAITPWFSSCTVQVTRDMGFTTIALRWWGYRPARLTAHVSVSQQMEGGYTPGLELGHLSVISLSTW